MLSICNEYKGKLYLSLMSKGTTIYRIKDEAALHYLTFSTVEWIDVFTRKRYKDIVELAEEYLYSSAKNYSGEKGLLEVAEI